MRALTAVLSAIVLATAACSSDDGPAHPYATPAAAIGESLAVLGWNIGVSNLRWDADHVLVDVDATSKKREKKKART